MQYGLAKPKLSLESLPKWDNLSKSIQQQGMVVPRLHLHEIVLVCWLALDESLQTIDFLFLAFKFALVC